MKTGVKILIIVLCLIVMGIVGYFVWDKYFKNNNNSNNETTNSTTINNGDTTPSNLVVSREGTEEEVPSNEYSSTYGYTIRYATDYFEVSNHDDKDWFESSYTNCVVVSKENVSYAKKIENIKDYTKTTVNGYEAVYTTRKVEGQAETTYFINTGKDYIYELTTSCQDTTEFLEGLGHIMDAMVQTFTIK